MSGLLFVVGAIAVVAGVVMVGFGIPINEFSFGNTLIVAGTTAVVGGLIVIALGVVGCQVAADHRGAGDARADPVQPAGRNVRSRSRLALPPAAGRIPFPPKPKSDAGIREPQPSSRAGAAPPSRLCRVDEPRPPSSAPTLRNPDEAAGRRSMMRFRCRRSIRWPRRPGAADLGEPAAVTPPFGANGSGWPESHEPTLDAAWRSPPPPAAPPQTRQPQTALFRRHVAGRSQAGQDAGRRRRQMLEPKSSPPCEPPLAGQPRRAGSAEARPASEPRAVAILKSGVVDGMGYTLYVDGSIEAELPQGTLRFASINELRSHLEKNFVEQPRDNATPRAAGDVVFVRQR